MKNMKKIIIILLLNIIHTNYVKEIIIIGNLKTKTSIIYRNIKHPDNSPFNIDIAKNKDTKLAIITGQLEINIP